MSFPFARIRGTGEANPSPSQIWNDLPGDFENPAVCTHIFETFAFGPHLASASQIAYHGNYAAYTSSGGLIAPRSTGGGVVLSSDGDNEGASLWAIGQPIRIARANKKVWFETCVKTSTIADTKHGIFVGLIEAPAESAGIPTEPSATIPIAAAGTLADNNLIGFHRLEGDGDYWDTTYMANGVTQVIVQADAKVIVADTYQRLGIKFDPADNYVRFYVDGVELATEKLVPATNDGTDMPDDINLGFVLSLLNATGSTPGTMTCAWYRLAQLV